MNAPIKLIGDAAPVCEASSVKPASRPFGLVLAVWLTLCGAGIGFSAAVQFIFPQNDAEFAEGFLAGCGRPCVIRDNPGGRLTRYEALADRVNALDLEVVITGECASACALFADLARKHIIIFRGAEFKFHRASDESVPPQSADVDAWVKEHGDYPAYASHQMTLMPYSAARRFWQPLHLDDRIPRTLRESWPPLSASPLLAGLPILPAGLIP